MNSRASSGCLLYFCYAILTICLAFAALIFLFACVSCSMNTNTRADYPNAFELISDRGEKEIPKEEGLRATGDWADTSSLTMEYDEDYFNPDREKVKNSVVQTNLTRGEAFQVYWTDYYDESGLMSASYSYVYTRSVETLRCDATFSTELSISDAQTRSYLYENLRLVIDDLLSRMEETYGFSPSYWGEFEIIDVLDLDLTVEGFLDATG